eukprot:1409641-Rhodomonas_salina.1
MTVVFPQIGFMESAPGVADVFVPPHVMQPHIHALSVGSIVAVRAERHSYGTASYRALEIEALGERGGKSCAGKEGEPQDERSAEKRAGGEGEKKAKQGRRVDASFEEEERGAQAGGGCASALHVDARGADGDRDASVREGAPAVLSSAHEGPRREESNVRAQVQPRAASTGLSSQKDYDAGRAFDDGSCDEESSEDRGGEGSSSEEEEEGPPPLVDEDSILQSPTREFDVGDALSSLYLSSNPDFS